MVENNAHSDGRIRLPAPGDMSAEQLADYHANPTARTNLARLLAVAPTLFPGFKALNTALATAITIPPLEREIVTLAVLFLERGEYEIAQHREVAKMMGIAEAKVTAIAEERYGAAIFDSRERALLAFTRQVVRSVRVDDAIYDAVAAFYDDRQIVEILFVITNYMMILRLSEVAELTIDGVDGAGFWRDKMKAQ